MIPVAARLLRQASRAWLTGPLRAVDLLAGIRCGDLEPCLIRHRRSPK